MSASELEIPHADVAVSELLLHLGRKAYRGEAFYFSKTGAHRYDDPKHIYGTLYLGYDLPTVLMETVFHDHTWGTAITRPPNRSVTKAEIDDRIVRQVGVISTLKLADPFAPGVMASQLGMNLGQLIDRDYKDTQRLSSLIHAAMNLDKTFKFDGIIFPSRNNYPARCICLFDRAKSKIDLTADLDLAAHADWSKFVKRNHLFVGFV